MESLNMALYLNILFFGLIGLGALFGLWRGFKKSLYSFIVKLIFYVLFFVSLTFMITFLWTMESAAIGNSLASLDASLAGVTSLSEALPLMVESALGEEFEATLANENFLAFAEAIGLFMVKIAYTIFYFTIFNIIYRFIAFLVRIIFFRTKKEDKFKPKRRGLGAGMGALSGVMSVFVFLILFGGMMDIVSSLMVLVDTEEDTQTLSYPAETRPLDNGDNLDPEMQAQMDDMRQVVEAYENNIVVRAVYMISLEEEDTGRHVPVVLRLFDTVFSIDYNEQKIPLRNEIAIISEVAAIFTESDYAGSGDLADVTSAEIIEAFNLLSNSQLVTSLTPLAIEMAADHSDVELDLDTDELYAIDWQLEIAQLGAIVATGFDILQTANYFSDDETEFETHVFDGDDFRMLFNEISDSRMMNLVAYAAMRPLLENMEGNMSAVLTVPEDLVWEDEFKAFGEVIGTVLDTGITVAELQAEDNVNTLLDRFSQMDMTVIIESKLMSQAMINIFSGALEMEELTMVVPQTVVWEDTLDAHDNISEKGELRVILEALNALTAEAANIDMDEFNETILLSIEASLVEELLKSEVLSATLGYLIYEQSISVEELIVPSSVLEEITDKDDVVYEVVVGDEILSMVKTIQLLNLGDLENFGTQILADVEDDDIEDLFQSKIIHATLSKVIIDMGEEEDPFITVPHTNALGDEDIRYIDEEDTLEYITISELSSIVRGLIALGITEDVSVIQNINLELINDNIEVLLDSAVLHLTISKQVIDMDGDMIVVPYYEEDDSPVRVMQVSGEHSNEYIVRDELITLLNALEILGVLDVEGFDGNFDLSVLEDDNKRADVIASNILQATISDTLFEMATTDGILDIPEYSEQGDAVIIIVGSDETVTSYISEDELNHFILALIMLGLTDNVDNFDGGINMEDLAEDENKDILLASAIMHMTVTEQLLDLGNDVLIMPDDVIITINNDTYVEGDEIKALIDAFDVLGFMDVGSAASVDPSMLDEASIDILLKSASMQVTISDFILSNNPLDENDLPSPNMQLVVPSVHKEDVDVKGLAVDQIEIEELRSLLNGLVVIGVDDFSGGMDASLINALADDIDLVLESDSLYLTVDNMIKANAAISDDIPDLAIEGTYLGVADVTSKPEIKDFIKAADVIAGDGEDFTNIAFTLSDIAAMSTAERDTVLNSMIVRNILTDEIEAAIETDTGLQPGDAGYESFFEETDYEEDDYSNFIRKQPMIDYLE